VNVLPRVVQELIEKLENLPGVGPRTAARLAYYFLRAPENVSTELAKVLIDIKKEIVLCENCFNYSAEKLCPICSNNSRDESILMVVEEPLDIVAFERMGDFQGVYHVLGGVISPINGIGPEEIRVEELLNRIKEKSISEIIIATNPNLEGESTALYIRNEINKVRKEVKITRIARGLPSGADLEYADDLTLQKALEGRGEF
jgi:recombination protein RecR